MTTGFFFRLFLFGVFFDPAHTHTHTQLHSFLIPLLHSFSFRTEQEPLALATLCAKVPSNMPLGGAAFYFYYCAVFEPADGHCVLSREMCVSVAADLPLGKVSL